MMESSNGWCRGGGGGSRAAGWLVAVVDGSAGGKEENGRVSPSISQSAVESGAPRYRATHDWWNGTSRRTGRL